MKNIILKSETFLICGMEVNVEWKNIKNIYLKIHRKDGKVSVSAPAETSYSQIKDFVEKKEKWVKKHLTGQFLKADISPVPEFRSGERLMLWGKAYSLVLREYSGRAFIRTDEVIKRIELYCRPDFSEEMRRRIWKEWCRQQLAEEIPKLIRKWEPVMKVKVREWRIRDMKTRWGTCNITMSRIWLSLQLIKKPKECLEEVVVHEMVHLLEPGHNKRFYYYMDCYLPQWKIWNEWLKNPL